MSQFNRKNLSSNTYKTNIVPIGLKNGVNLEYTLPNNEAFIDGTLSVFLSGIHLNGDQLDSDKDYEIYPDKTGFKILIDPSKSYRLNSAPKCIEDLLISYMMKTEGCNPIIF